MTANSQNTDSIMSDDTALGVLDTDGGVLIVIDENNGGSQPFGVRVIHYLGQSNKKRDLVKKVAHKFNCPVNENEQENRTEIRVGPSSPCWETFRQFYLRNKPINPGRRRDFLISEKIKLLCDSDEHFTKLGQVILIKLAFSITKEVIFTSSRKRTFKEWVNLIKANETEYQLGIQKAKDLLNEIESEIHQLEETLPDMVLSKDYIRGAHFGDGGLTVALTWNWDPNSNPKDLRLRCEPNWTISGENKAYCKSFIKSIGVGIINMSGRNCNRYCLAGIDKCYSHFLPLFPEDVWMPQYKRALFNRFKMALSLLKNKEHFTKEGIKKLVYLVFELGEKGDRKKTKQQYINDGCEILRAKGYI